jgi:hypothetical protein
MVQTLSRLYSGFCTAAAPSEIRRADRMAGKNLDIRRAGQIN